MPNIDLVELGKLAFKIAIILLLASLLLGFVGSFVSIIFNIISYASGSLDGLNGLDLGYVASAIGLVTFLNSLFASLYVAGSILLSATALILGWRFGTKILKIITNI